MWCVDMSMGVSWCPRWGIVSCAFPHFSLVYYVVVCGISFVVYVAMNCIARLLFDARSLWSLWVLAAPV